MWKERKGAGQLGHVGGSRGIGRKAGFVDWKSVR